MSTSELRRGPGWWMDLDGQWNPPEEWPESNPPLPGWVRGADGFWYEPAITPADLEQPLDESNSATVQRVTMRPVPDVGRPTTIPSLSTLRQSPDEADTDPATNGHRPHLRIAPDRPPVGLILPDTPSVGLSFSGETADPAVFFEDVRLRRRAVIAALVASVTASMLAAGLVLLLVLL